MLVAKNFTVELKMTDKRLLNIFFPFETKQFYVLSKFGTIIKLCYPEYTKA